MEEVLKINGYDKAIIGRANVWQSNTKVETLIYNGNILMQILQNSDGMTEEEALEYIDFNIECAYMGPSTPIIMWDVNE